MNELAEALKAYNEAHETPIHLIEDVILHKKDGSMYDNFDTEAEAIQWLRDNTPKSKADELIEYLELGEGSIRHNIKYWFKEQGL